MGAWALFLSISLFPFAACVADSHPEYEPPYGEKLKPKPFKYEYGLHSPSSDAAFSKKETQDERGNVIGEVVVSLPDGRVQTINYNADHYDGYNADVKYVGTPEYPPGEQHQNYNAPKFIPVHLKSRPGIPIIQPQPDKVYHKSRPLPSHTNSGFKNFPYRNRQKQNVLQQEFKSIESSESNIPEPVLPLEVKPQEITFEPVKINPIELPAEVPRTSVQNTRKRPQNFAISSDSESMAEMMAKITEDLKNINKAKEVSIIIPERNANTQFTVTNTKAADSMAEMMKKIREDLKKEESKPARLPSINPQTPPLMVIKSHVMSAPKDKMADIMKRMKENREKNSSKKPMSIKSHIKSPMSIKSHVISAPPVAESMAEIMKKIREDFKNSEQSSKVELPGAVMTIKSHIKQAPKVMQVMSHVIENPKLSEISTNKPLRDSVVEFMTKVELMQEKENKSNGSIMSV